MTKYSGKLMIFDPNSVNPYGAELARVLSSEETDVTLYSAGVGGKYYSPTISLHLNRAPGLIGLISWGLNRLLAPLKFATASLLSRNSICILVWIRDPWQALVMLGLSKFRSVYWIDHNPVGTRMQSEPSGISRLLRKGVKASPVHSEILDGGKEPTISHPSYRGMVSSVREEERSLLSVESGRTQFAYIGALRPDKGADVLVEVCRLFSRPYHLTLVGCREIPDDLWIAVQESAVGTVEAIDFPVSDSDFVSHISRTDLILAPYIEPTQSGSLILALTVGATAIAFEGGAIGELLPDRQLIARGDSAEFAKRAFEVLDQGGSSWRVSAVQLDADCWRSWMKILVQ